jgi:anti-anti-sigma factor
MTTKFKEIEELLEKKSAPILLVNENREELRELAKLLTHAGYLVIQTDSSDKAEDLLRTNNVSIILAFHKKNGPSGLYLMAKAKEIKPHALRLLIGNASLPEHLTKQADPLYLFEGEDKEKLIEQIDRCFESYQLHKENQLMQSMLHKHHDELSKIAKQNTAHQLLGAKIQKALLIDTPPRQISGVSITSSSSGSKEVDGDFIAFFQPLPYILDFALGDVMGKGLASTLIATALKNEIALYANLKNHRAFYYDHIHFWREDLPDMRDVLKKVHTSLFERLVDLEFYVSLFFGRLDLQKRTFTFIDCGFTKPLYFRKASGKATFISASNFPIGTVPYPEFSPFEIHYDKGDFFLLYSDGLTESQSPDGALFGEERLAKLIEKHADLSSDQLTDKIKEEVASFIQSKNLDDDLTFLILKIDHFMPSKENPQRAAKFSSALGQLEAARGWVKEVVQKAPGDQDRLATELQLALDEVFTNIVLHGYGGNPGSPICFQAELDEEFLRIDVLDQADSFDPNRLPTLNLCGDMEHGYGWFLITKIIDELQYIPKATKAGWNRLCLKKRYLKRGIFMELSHHERDDALIIRLDFDSLDAKRVPEFKEKALQILNESNKTTVVFDLERLQFIDSSGLGAFLSLMRQLNTRGIHLALSSMSKPVKTIFELVSMQKIFDCHETVDKAVLGKVKK